MTLDLSTIIPDKAKALFLAKRQLSELVCDSVNLEGIHYTLPEVQTLLDGITVGGHRLSEERITLNQAAAWRRLFTLVAEQKFSVTKEIACELHAIAAHEESLTWGAFRHGAVTIAGTDYLPAAAIQLDQLWLDTLQHMDQIPDIYERAIFLFLQMARIQFFYDVNKRMGRLMMNGLLLSAGYPAINLPAKRQLEFNQLMLQFYPTGNRDPMTEFMKSCLEEKIITIMSEKAE